MRDKMIDEIEGIVVMVSDQQKALEFYTKKLGFEKKVDTGIAGYRWIVVGPKNSNMVLSLVDSSQMKNESQKNIEHAKNKIGTSTGIWFHTKNMDATHKELRSKGVKVTNPNKQDWGGIMCTIYDQDANEIGLVGDTKG